MTTSAEMLALADEIENCNLIEIMVCEPLKDNAVFRNLNFDEEKLIVAALRAAATRDDAVREALESARQEIVLTIAFLGRDAGSERLQDTITGLIARLAKADAKILAVLQGAKP